MSGLERLTTAVKRWDAARRTVRYRSLGAAFAVGVFAAVWFAPWPPDLPPEARSTACLAAVMAVLWVGGVLPMAVTALLPLVLLPLLGVTDVKGAAAPYAHPLNFLMLGGFVIGHAVERVGLHERLVAGLLAPRWVRSSPRRVALALMVVTAGLSGIVSNTATMLMMLPIAASLGALCCDTPRQRASMVLAMAYAASIGGVWTLVGTPPNAVLAGLAADQAGVSIGFARWMTIGVPFTVVAVPVAWVVVTWGVMPLPRAPSRPLAPRPAGPLRHGELPVIAVLALAMVAWATRSGVDLGAVSMPGWGDALAHGAMLHDAWVAIAAAVLLFLVPGPAEVGQRRRPLLRWQEAERAIPWSVILLLGGGFSLAAAISGSGLTAWLAAQADFLAAVPTPLAVLGICVAMTFVTELTSNTASTQIALPLLAATASQVGVEPLMWMVPATISASCAFMMPVATAPNAIASEAGRVSPGDMALAGLALNVALAGIVAALSLAIVPGWL